MKKFFKPILQFALILLIGSGIIIGVSFIVNKLKKPDVILIEKQYQYIDWECRIIDTCPWRDWRYADPEEVCSYKTVKYTLRYNDKPTLGSKGEWCKSETGEIIKHKSTPI